MGEIYIGTAGWQYKDWDGIVYPPELKKRKQHPLGYLAQFFDLVEINTSFYGHLKPEVVNKWVELASANPRFRFTAKLNSRISLKHLPLWCVLPWKQNA